MLQVRNRHSWKKQENELVRYVEERVLCSPRSGSKKEQFAQGIFVSIGVGLVVIWMEPGAKAAKYITLR